jgi:predicted lipoprotein
MIKFFFRTAPLLAALLLLFNACDSAGGPDTPNFDRKAMLQDYVTNLIRPAYGDLRAKAQTLYDAAQTFQSAPSLSALQSLQNAWQATALVWQYANAYNFGPAGEEGLRKSLVEEIGTFPASSAKIDAVIAAGAWNLNDFNRDARGLPAIEYLIFSATGDDAAILAAFNATPARGQYLTALTQDLLTRVTAVHDAWLGSHATTFVENAGTDAGSSTSLLYNEMLRSFEAMKNFKLGLPMGKRPGQTMAEPQLVEAPYSGASLLLLRNHFNAVEDIWRGKNAAGADGIGFREYLEKVEGGPALIQSTEAQMAAVRAAFDAVPDSPVLSEQITQSPAAVEALYTEIQKLTRYLKSDMSSLLGIAITYSSGDGD